jgi:hypothetical protein
VAIAARLGLRWRLWPDVTDLLALSVLPAGWWIAAQRRGRVLHPARRVLEPAGVLVGALACLATGSVGSHPHYPFFVNRTAEPQTLSLTWLLRKVDCQGDIAQVALTLNSDDLDDSRSVTLTSGEVAALDVPPAAQADVAGVCQNSPSNNTAPSESCTAVVVSVPNGPAVLVSATRHWEVPQGESSPLSCSSPPSTTSTCAPVMSISQDPGDDALSLTESGSQMVFKAGGKLKMASINLIEVMARPAGTTGCRTQRDQIHALLDSASACTADADCQVINVDMAIPGDGICNVYVNRSLSFPTILQAHDLWNEQCATDDRFYCYSQNPVQPAVCRFGQCMGLCPGLIIPGCPDSCASMGVSAGDSCASPHVGHNCLASDGQYCTCVGEEPTLSCVPPSQVTPGCPIACTSDYPLSASGPNAYNADASVSDAALAARATEARKPLDATTSHGDLGSLDNASSSADSLLP